MLYYIEIIWGPKYCITFSLFPVEYIVLGSKLSVSVDSAEVSPSLPFSISRPLLLCGLLFALLTYFTFSVFYSFHLEAND